MLTRLRRLPARVRALFVSGRLDDDFDEELAAHLAMAIEDYQRKGLPPDEARRMALVRLGSPASLGQQHRRERALPVVEEIGRDVRYAFRTLRRDSALTTFAVLIVGLGIGLAATVFSVVQALLLRPLPFDRPDQLVWIANGSSENLSEQTAQVVNLLTLREQSQSLAGVQGYSPFYGVGDVHLTGDGGPERVTAVRVTEGFFDLLGVRPYLGRYFTPDECLFNGPRVVVLGHGFWRARFAADPGVVGRAVTLNGQPATIVGVLPRSFDFADTFTPGNPADVFTPFPLSAETNRQGNTLALIGRLRPGAEIVAASAEASLIGDRIQATLGQNAMNGNRNGFRPRITPLRNRISGSYRDALLALAVSVGFVVLLVCANLSNLLLSRSAARQREIAIRTALGASRPQLVRQVLVESLVLTGSGGSLGLLLAWMATGVMSRLGDTGIPLLHDVRVDTLTVGAAVLAAVVTGIVVGLLPALRVSATAPNLVLQRSSRGALGGSRDRVRRAIVVVQVAVACVLLAGAGLLIRSLTRLLDVDPGFAPERLIAVRVDPGRTVARDRVPAYFDEIVQRVRAIPHVDAVGLSDALPLGNNFGWRRWSVAAAEHAQDRSRRQQPLIRVVDEGYIGAMRIPVRAGRAFTADDADHGQPVAIVNETLARRLWPDGDAVGRFLVVSRVERRVIGIVAGVRYFGLDRDADMELYLPMRQNRDHSVVDLVVRTTADPERAIPDVRAALAAAFPNLPTTQIRTMEQLLDRSVFGRRAATGLLAGFAGFGLLLAALGMYAVVSYAVSRRRQEFALRMALGASPSAIRASVLAQTITLSLTGLAIGLPAAWLAARAARALLFDVAPADPVTIVGVVAILASVIVVAADIPSRRAARMDPVVALRGD